jgi:anion-transporting  ArsA/GET3 family ATPase
MNFEDLFKAHNVIICVGSGGVGKTTISASLGVRAAQLGFKVLVVTIDPSLRLKAALGVDDKSFKPTLVPRQKYKGQLSALLLNAENIFREFIVEATTRPELAEQLLNNRLYQQLSTTLSGSQEFTSLLQLTTIVASKDYDVIILDTPPAQHAVDFLEAPEKIQALFHDRMVRWFVGEDDSVGFVQKIISRSTKLVLGALERITGSVFMKELNGFFSSIRMVQSKIAERTDLVQKILHSEKTGFVLVTGFDEAKLQEAGALFTYLDARKYHLRGAIINRAYFEELKDIDAPAGSSLAKEYTRWAKYHSVRAAYFQDFVNKWGARLPVVRMANLSQDINGLHGLEVFANEMDSAFHRSNNGASSPRLHP